MVFPFPESLPAGAILDEYYQIDGALGEGGFADVYSGIQRDTGLPIAVKILRPVKENVRETFTRRFVQEARIAARIKHPNIVTVLACRDTMRLRMPGGDEAPFDRCYIVMEKLHGHTLEDEIASQGAMDPDRALELMVGCLDGLAEGHALGIVHKDLKPSNLFLINPGQRSEMLKILDFGIARVGQTQTEKITQTGEAVFTPQYAAPEYLESLIATPALDVYQMALIFSEMLTGQTVVDCDTVFACMLTHTKGVELPESLKSSPFGPLLAKALHRDHTQRMPDAAAFCTALEAISKGGSGPILPDKTEEWNAIPSDAASPIEAEAPPEPASQPIPASKRSMVPMAVAVFLGVVMLCGLGSFGALAMLDELDKAEKKRLQVDTGEFPDSELIPVGDSEIKGPVDAPVTIVAFMEFECAYCKRSQTTLGKVYRAWPSEVRLVYKHSPLPELHEHAPLASEAALAAGDQGKFWEYHDMLFSNQDALDRKALEKYAKAVGLDLVQFNEALDTGQFRAAVAKDKALGEKLGARGTPNFFVNGFKLVGAKSFKDFKKIVEREIEATKGRDASVYPDRVRANFSAAGQKED